MLHRLFISADIEGTCGIAHWDETELGKPDYTPFRQQMTREVNAACLGALESGAEDILIKDAHDSARNLMPEMLPEQIQIFRGWGSDIHSMMSGIDGSFTGAFFTGYHSSSNTDTNPLSHTMNTQNISITINGIQTSEMLINLYAAALYDVPVLMITGDLGVCEQAKRISPNIFTVPVSQGRGNGSISIHPNVALKRIQETAKTAFEEGIAHPERFAVSLPNKFDVEVSFVQHNKARRASFYPGVRQTGPRSVRFSSDAYYDVLRFFMFCL
ncbi:MAG: M55 family metallopeptidase [Clostridia bacterium]|nr:M55 family metallopeptidase [Clostridia bacterium]